MPHPHSVLPDHGAEQGRRPTSGLLALEGASLMVVEDDLGDRLLLEQALRRVGLDGPPRFAGTMAEALHAVRTDPPDLVLLDIGLPDAAGIAALTAVVEAAPEVPVVVLTGLDDVHGTGLAAVRAGAQDYLVKGRAPPDAIARSVRFALERSALARELASQRRQRHAVGRIEAAGREMPSIEWLLEQVVEELHGAMSDWSVHIELHVDDTTWSAGIDTRREAQVTKPHRDVAPVDFTVECESMAGCWGRLRVLTDRTSGVLTRDEQLFVEEVAGLVGDSVRAFANAGALRGRSLHLRALHDVSEAVRRSDGRDVLVSTVAAALARATSATRVQVTVAGTAAESGASTLPAVATLEAAVLVDGLPAGLVRLGYREGSSGLQEDQALVERTADLLGVWLGARQAEQASRREAERLAHLMTTTPVGVLFVEADGRVTYGNPEARRIFGLGPGEPVDGLLGHAAGGTANADGEPIDITGTLFEQVRTSGHPIRDVVRVIRPRNGARRVISINASPIAGADGTFDGVVVAVSDITEQDAGQRELAESRARLTMLVTQLPAVVWTVDRDLVFTSISGSGLQLLESAPGVGDDFTAYFGQGPDFLPVEAHRAALDGHSRTYSFGWDDTWWRVAVQPLRDAAGRVVGAVGLGLDCTTEKRAVERAHLEEARYRSLFERSVDAIVLIDDDGRYVDVNPAACALIGLDRDALIGRLAADVHDESLDDADRETLRRIHAQLRDRGELAGTDLFLRPDGEIVELEYSATAGVQPGVHMAIVRDVTERRRTQRALTASEERFRTLAEAAVEGIFRLRIEPERRFDYVNPAFERIIGVGRDQIMADADVVRARIHPDDLHLLDLDGPVTLRFEHPVTGERRLTVHETRVEEDDGSVAIVHGLLRDVTEEWERREALADALGRERAAADKLRRLDELKAGFLRAVSHELRTPLTSIYGLGVTIHDNYEQLDDERRLELLGRVVANAERLRHLLTDLLDVGRLTAGDVEPRREAVDLAELVDLTDLAEVMARHRLQLDVRPTAAHVEPAAVRRIIHNLIDNAGRHTPPGTTVWVRTFPGPDGTAHLVVEDDGPGLPQDVDGDIFDAFVQGSEAAASAQPGTGVGLSLVRQLVTLHGGTVLAEPRPGGGACFRASFPS